jgi:four helix bundle protein
MILLKPTCWKDRNRHRDNKHQIPITEYRLTDYRIPNTDYRLTDLPITDLPITEYRLTDYPTMEYVESYKDLKVYRASRQLAKEIFSITKDFPKGEMFSLTDQIRRSSRSVGAQIAEAWAKRRYEKHFVSKLTDADGEQQETQHWIETALDCNYLTTDAATNLLKQCSSIGKMVSTMISKSSTFCKPPVKK